MTPDAPRRLLNSVSLLATERATLTLARMSATHEYSPRSESSFSARPTFSSRRVLAAGLGRRRSARAATLERGTASSGDMPRLSAAPCKDLASAFGSGSCQACGPSRGWCC